ncbi:hypothetical protein CWO85_00725 [Candidatus Phytoplasma ziziphi]|uniref:Uncharacterized protein n=1 Tax=Ziziphus jujuba witches'-broom phytoplasma TaxID=135727 RepID=A0A660HM01_ZIZJU|nr:hypothetical protein [Candidatus Phytoplasma ziziphi]AYJ01064.1 hypothetical protein CWO85_00725 [Candidatus Phytoplasma ziziphi]
MIKEEVTKKDIFSTLAKGLFFLIVAIAFWLHDKFTITISSYDINIYKILLGCLIICITYLLVLPSFKKNTGFVKFLFLIEAFIFVLVSLGLIFHFLIDTEQKFLKNITELHFIFYYIFIIHSIIKLYIGFKLSDKKDIFASFKFVIYIATLSTSFFLMGKEVDVTEYIMIMLSILFLLFFVYYLYLASKKISIFNNKEKSIIETEE